MISKDILDFLQVLVKDAGHSWNLTPKQQPDEIAYSVVKIGGHSYRSYQEPTMAEYTINALAERETSRLTEVLKRQIINYGKEVYAAYPEAFDNEQAAMSFLVGGKTEEAIAIYNKAVTARPDILYSLDEIFNVPNEHVDLSRKTAQKLLDYALLFFLGSRIVSETEITPDLLASVTPKTLRKLREFMTAECLKGDEAEDGEAEPVSEEPTAVGKG